MTVQDMTQSNQKLSDGASEELGQWLRGLRTHTLTWVLPGVLFLGLSVLGSLAVRDNIYQILGTSAALIGLAVWVWLMREQAYKVAVWSLVVGSLVAILSVASWSGLEPALNLLALPAGLAMLLISRPAGVATGIVCTAWLVGASRGYVPAGAALRLIAAIALWGTLGIVWLTLTPLLTAVRWTWASYQHSNEMLTQARETQVRLHQTLADLTRANRQLVRLNRLAQGLRQEADNERRAKEEFVAKVSHELRTPLNMIIGFCEMMTQTPEIYGIGGPASGGPSQTLLADLDVVLRNSQHLSGLIDDVLDLSQIEAGQMALSKERASLAEIIDAAVIAVRPLYDSKALYLETDVATDLPPVFCDRMRIREVVLNLLSNAGRFTEEGGVRVRAWQKDGAQPTVVVSVQDTGPGIPKGERERLFRPFQQLDNTLRRRYGGTGLGLSISKNFVELHDGAMWVESTPGQGTTFFFSLPVEPAIRLDGDDARRWFSPYAAYDDHNHVQRLPTSANVHPRMVIVEEGRATQQLLTRHLDAVEAVRYPTWEQALEDIAHTPAQAILVNEADVSSALNRLSASPPPPYDLPVLICNVPATNQMAGDYHVNGYLVKPVSRKKLLRALDGVDREVETVLVVDDEPDTHRLLWRMLESAGRGYRMLRAYDGQQALAFLADERPDVILLDLTMPDMDGFQFLATRDSDPALRDIPVFIISARDPLGHPIVSQSLAITRTRGLSIRELLECIKAFSAIMAMGPTRTAAVGDPARPVMSHD